MIAIGEVIGMTSLSKSTIYRLMGEGDFPQPVALTPCTKRWVESEVQAWIDERIEAARAPLAVGQD
jgi:prophage regulatory protein